MIIGIETLNIKVGGGVTYLQNLLNQLENDSRITKIILWVTPDLQKRLRGSDKIIFHRLSGFKSQLWYRAYWQLFRLGWECYRCHCDVLFVPGSLYIGFFRPFVTVAQNLLPFESREVRQYRYSFKWLRLHLLRILQAYTFHRAACTISLTQYAADVLIRLNRCPRDRIDVILPGGLDGAMQPKPRSYAQPRVLRLVYVSTIDNYKHHVEVVRAVSMLRESGLPVVLDLIGGIYKPAMRMLNQAILRQDPEGEFVYYHGHLSRDAITHFYQTSDVFVFASSCESLGFVLLEAMAHRLPIACSNRSVMPSVLGDAGLYFDPEKPQEIADAIEQLYHDPELRQSLANQAYERSKQYSWEACGEATARVIHEAYQSYHERAPA